MKPQPIASIINSTAEHRRAHLTSLGSVRRIQFLVLADLSGSCKSKISLNLTSYEEMRLFVVRRKSSYFVHEITHHIPVLTFGMIALSLLALQRDQSCAGQPEPVFHTDISVQAESILRPLMPGQADDRDAYMCMPALRKTSLAGLRWRTFHLLTKTLPSQLTCRGDAFA